MGDAHPNIQPTLGHGHAIKASYMASTKLITWSARRLDGPCIRAHATLARAPSIFKCKIKVSPGPKLPQRHQNTSVMVIVLPNTTYGMSMNAGKLYWGSEPKFESHEVSLLLAPSKW